MSDLANQLTKNGKLVVPGGLEVKGNLSVDGKARIGSSCEVNTLKKAKNNMFIVHHPEGGFFYFNNAPGFGTYGIPNKNLIISAQDVNTTGIVNTGTVRCVKMLQLQIASILVILSKLKKDYMVDYSM